MGGGVCEGAGLKVFFDRSDLTDISAEVLERSVKQSRVLVTVLDPYTFESVWCVRENRWAAAAGRPIVPIYDGDRHRWDTCRGNGAEVTRTSSRNKHQLQQGLPFRNRS